MSRTITHSMKATQSQLSSPTRKMDGSPRQGNAWKRVRRAYPGTDYGIDKSTVCVGGGARIKWLTSEIIKAASSPCIIHASHALVQPLPSMT